jgi:hypothetical protein
VEKKRAFVYPEITPSGNKLGDFVFFWVVKKHREKNKPWTASDNLVWRVGCYVIPEYIGVIVFMGIFWWLVGALSRIYADPWKVLYFLLIVMLVRLNAMIKVLNKISQRK